MNRQKTPGTQLYAESPAPRFLVRNSSGLHSFEVPTTYEPGAQNVLDLALPVELEDGKPATYWHEELKTSMAEGQFFTFEPRSADVVGPVSAVLNVQAGPTGFDLSRFPEGGQLGKDVDGQRTVTFLRGRH